ncbi:MAG TPA: hypothetical protein VIR27_18480 [Mycobacteriales bacterium]|jgi:hypothetical protein
MGDARTIALQDAITWVSGVFTDHRVPFQIVGGTAAFAHGGRRPIVDIDIYAPLSQAGPLLDEIRRHIVWGPESYRDQHWDLTFLKIDYGDARIEIGDTDSSPRYYSATHGMWLDQVIDYSRSVWLSVFDVVVPVMPLPELIEYKTALGRPVDLVDVAELHQGSSEQTPPGPPPR